LRNTTDVLRRGLDSTLANWQLIAIRIAENILLVLLVIASIIAAIVPVAVAAGLSHFDFQNADNAVQVIAAMVVEHWALILYILVIITVVLGVMIAVHSFVEAGNTKVFVDAERGAGGAPVPQRAALRAFTIDRWLQGVAFYRNPA
jgi:heme/copper-type cytochrome/quinol oxidase subunit 2